jgi:hypothetical protein
MVLKALYTKASGRAAASNSPDDVPCCHRASAAGASVKGFVVSMTTLPGPTPLQVMLSHQFADEVTNRVGNVADKIPGLTFKVVFKPSSLLQKNYETAKLIRFSLAIFQPL